MQKFRLIFLGFVKYSKLEQAKYLNRELFNSVKDTFTFPVKVDEDLRDSYAKALGQARHQLESTLPNKEFSKEEREVLSSFFFSFETWSKTLSNPISQEGFWTNEITNYEISENVWIDLLQVVENSSFLTEFFKLDDAKKRLFQRVSQMKHEEILPSFVVD